MRAKCLLERSSHLNVEVREKSRCTPLGYVESRRNNAAGNQGGNNE